MKLIISILSVILLMGCKTASSNYNKESRYSSELIESTSIQRIGTQFSVDSFLHKYKVKINGIQRVYGVPDSAGVQPIISENNYTIDLVGDKQYINKLSNHSNLNLKDDKKKTNQGDLNESGRNDTDNRIFRPPEWSYYVFGLILILFIIYKTKKTFSS